MRRTSSASSRADACRFRGNGRLALTNDELVFPQWLPRRTLRISRERILEVESARSHLGKTMGRNLLRVRFRREDGSEDAAAWFVRDLDRWLAVIGP